VPYSSPVLNPLPDAADEVLDELNEILDPTNLIDIIAGPQNSPSPVLVQAVEEYYQRTSCTAVDYDELNDAITNATCSIILLPSMEYNITEEIVVRRRVTLLGLSPIDLVQIRCDNAVRCFRIVRGGYFSLRYVRTLPGGGIIRRRRRPVNGILSDQSRVSGGGGGGGGSGGGGSSSSSSSGSSSSSSSCSSSSVSSSRTIRLIDLIGLVKEPLIKSEKNSSNSSGSGNSSSSSSSSSSSNPSCILNPPPLLPPSSNPNPRP